MEDTATQSSGSAATGPASFSDASLTWSEASPASTPTTDGTLADSASADATAPPATDAPADGSPQQGEPPKERWNDILANARTKAAEEALAPVAWATQIDPQEFQQIQKIASHFAKGDPITGLQEMIAEIRKDPRYDAELKSLAARALSHGRSQGQAQPAEPQLVEIQLEDGSTVAVPRDPAAWLAHQRQQWQAEQDQRLAPVVQSHQQLQAERAAMAQQQAVTQFVTTTYADVQTWPGMDSAEMQKAVANELAQARIDANDPREVQIALNAAYRKVVLPTLGKKAEATLLDSLKRNAAAATGINPGSAAASTPKSVTRFSDLPAEAWR